MTKQIEIDFGEDVNESGYDLWRAECSARNAAIAKCWGLPIGKKVALKLYNIDGEFYGLLAVDVYPSKLNKKEPLRLRQGSMTFFSNEIEACVRI
jgi:hypothetical protein